eukprot:6480317-Amphidinium_carterae.1
MPLLVCCLVDHTYVRESPQQGELGSPRQSNSLHARPSLAWAGSGSYPARTKMARRLTAQRQPTGSNAQRRPASPKATRR